jgi:hypothetical protein
MLINGESRKEVVRPDFNRAIRIDFLGYKKRNRLGGKLWERSRWTIF